MITRILESFETSGDPLFHPAYASGNKSMNPNKKEEKQKAKTKKDEDSEEEKEKSKKKKGDSEKEKEKGTHKSVKKAGHILQLQQAP